MTSLLERIRVVLVEPRGPMNVGAVARAMKNFGLFDLRLVDAALLDHPEARMMASGAADVLENGRVHAGLESALEGAVYLVGSTARGRHRTPTIAPAAAAEEIARRAAEGPVALLFGREDHGLYAEELQRCHAVISIETSAERASLNLAQAVLLIAYEIFRRVPEDAVSAHRRLGALADDAMIDRMAEELIRCCERSGYLHEGSRKAIEDSIRRLVRIGPIQTRDARHVFALVRRVGKVLEGRTRDAGGAGERPS